jgi:hypothetical protein
MKAMIVNLRVAALMAAACCLAAAGAVCDEVSPAVTPSPTYLTFGVPDPQPGVSAIGTTSAQQKVTFSVTGESVTFNGTTAPGNPDFKIVQGTDTCSGKTIAAGSFCTVVLTFTPSVSGLETSSFSVNFSEQSVSVNLSGAAGAVKLFDPTFVANSSGSGSPLINYGTSPLVLSCPAGDSTPTGVLSSSPDGSGYVFEDNFLTLAVNGTPAATGNSPAGNVCRGGTADGDDNDCFTTNYQSVAGQLTGDNPDTFANPGNQVLAGSPNNAGGVPPINSLGPFLPPGSSNVTFTLLDNGGLVGGSTLFLVTNCAVTGVQQGGTIVSNPINGDNPGSQTPSFPFDTIGGQHIELGANFTALNGSSTTGNGIVENTVATTFDTGITQSQFATMVHGTSAAPAVCLRMTGELASDGVTPLCKAITIECTNMNSSTPAGENCPQSTLRNLLFSLAFDTPDSLNIIPGTGPALLMGQDTWASAGPNMPATPTACSFPTDGTDPLANQLCPQDLLTSFIGAGDPVPGGTTRGTNSTFVPALGVPLPFTVPIVALFQKTTTINLTFLVSPAIFFPVNGFTPAPIQSVTFGTTPAGTGVPDPTLPVPGDISLFNTGAAVGTCSSTPGGIFKTKTTTLTNDTSTGALLAEGRYNLHFFATDCASTEELLFIPSKNPAKNWASFKTIPIDIDLHAPTINNPMATRSNKTVTVTYSCTDPNIANAASGVVRCGTFLFPAVLTTPTLTSKFTVNTAGPGSIPLTATDLAGNSVTVNVPYN